MADTEFISLRQWVRYWEERSVEPRCSLSKVQRLDRLKQLAIDAAAELGMAPPDVRFIDLRDSSRVDYPKHIIYLGFGDRWELPLLHHIALLGSKSAPDPYGKQFMAVAMALYSKFLKIDRQLLQSGAEHFELEFSLLSEPETKPR